MILCQHHLKMILIPIEISMGNNSLVKKETYVDVNNILDESVNGAADEYGHGYIFGDGYGYG